MGEANFYYFTCLNQFFPIIRTRRRRTMAHEVSSQPELSAINEDIDSPTDESATAAIESATENGRASSTPRKTPTKLYVGNLSPKVTKDDLRDAFQKYGQVSDVDVVGTFAFVVMPNESEAEEAIRVLHDQEVDGKKLIVEKKKARPVAPRRGDRGRGVGSRDTQLFVAKCKDVPEERLREIFEKFGAVNSVQKPRSKPDIAFVSMAHFFEARKAIEALNKKPVEGLTRNIFVQLSTNNTTRDGRPLQALLERGETIKLFVGNLNKEKTDVKALGELFERYGPVFDVAILKDKGFGFVHMLSRESAEDAVRGLNRRDFNGASISVVFSVKKGMSISKQTPGGDRMGAQTMMPRLGMNRDGASSMRPNGDIFGDGMMDPLLALQQQINSQYLSSRSGFGALPARPPFNLDTLFPRDLVSYPYPGAASRSPVRREGEVRFAADERSRYANFVGGGTSPLKRGRSPVRGLQRLSPSPKRNFIDNRFSMNSPPRGEMSMANAESAMRRNSAKSMPPKMMRPRVF